MIKTAQVVFSRSAGAYKYDYYYDTTVLPELRPNSLVVVPAGNAISIGIVAGIESGLSKYATKCVYYVLPTKHLKANKDLQEAFFIEENGTMADWEELL